jgi:hypothetical protein
MATHRVLGVSARSAHSSLVPATRNERECAREQLERILVSPVFRNSKRYASVLRYIVEHTLDGRTDQLKERTIGIEVFGRTPDYDTASDHVVRSAAADIRKRLAQYYQEENTAGELRIELQPGSYIPQFRFAFKGMSADAVDAFESVHLPTHAQVGRSRWAWLGAWQSAILTVILITVAGAALLAVKSEDPLEAFWRPVLISRGQALLCIGNLEGGHASPGEQPLAVPITLKDFHESYSETVHVFDAMTLARFAGLLQAKGKPYQFASQSEATFTDLQNGPAVLVGLMNNDWTKRLVSKLRFTVELTGPRTITIRDHDHPLNNDWSTNYELPYLDVTKDYALVLRVSDPKTEQMVVVAAGISVFGTLAAGEFLTDTREMRKLAAVAPKGWEQKNMEIVLSTDVIKGRPGHATIVAAQFW